MSAPEAITWRTSLSRIAERVQADLETDAYPRRAGYPVLADAVRRYPLAGGKRMRPALVVWGSGLFGGTLRDALDVACAVEIFHNWTLVHDDWIDQDAVRRNAPTLHTVAADAFRADGHSEEDSAHWGASLAILSGDLMQGWVLDRLCAFGRKSNRMELAFSLMADLSAQLYPSLLSGETRDVAFSFREWGSVSRDEVLQMMSGKTSALLRYALLSGAKIGLKNAVLPSEIEKPLALYAELLGLVFQMRDDELGLFGKKQTFGKPIGGDFVERKITAMSGILFEKASEAMCEWENRYMPPGTYVLAPQALNALRKIAVESGALDELHETMQATHVAAEEVLETLPHNEYRDYLYALLNYAITREN